MIKKKTDTVMKTHQQIYEHSHSIVLMMETISEAALLIDPYKEGFPIIFVNRGFTEMTGYSNAEISGERYAVLEGKDTNNKISNMIVDAMKHERSTTVEILNYRKDGTSFWIEINLSPLYNEHGEVYAFIGIQKDITSKKQRMTDTTFYGEHGHHQAYINFINSFGFNEKIDQTISGLKEIEDDDVIGRYITDFVLDEDKEKVMNSFKRALTGYIENLIIRAVHSNGDINELDTLFIPSYNQGEINGVYTIFKNVTGYSEANKLMINAEKYDTAKRLALTVADTLDTTLTTLTGFIQLLKAQPHFAADYTELMLTEIERIEIATSGVRHLLKPRIIQTKKQNLRKILENICKVMYSSTLKANVHLHLNYKTSNEQIEIDQRGMEYIFIQLIKNAVESMPFGGDIFIEVKKQIDGMMLIQFIDEGQGIDEQEIDKVKEAFYTTKDDRVGISLTICENIINEHNGSLTLVNGEKKGLIATVRLSASI